MDLALVRPGLPVWYAIRPGTVYPAVVDGEPWQLAPGVWVVKLHELPEAFARETLGGTTWCPAALVLQLRPRRHGATFALLAEPVVIRFPLWWLVLGTLGWLGVWCGMRWA